MANLKELRSRISSVSSTMQITSAMKMVSAAKLSKAQEAIIAMRPYSQKLTELIQNLSATAEGDMGSALTEQRPESKFVCEVLNLHFHIHIVFTPIICLRKIHVFAACLHSVDNCF